MTSMEESDPVKENVIVEDEVSMEKANFLEDDVMATNKEGSSSTKAVKAKVVPPHVEGCHLNS